MPRLLSSAAVVALLVALPQAAMPQMATNPTKAPKQFQLLKADDFPPALLLPAPPQQGSAAEARELAEMERLIGAASKERLAQARWDAEHEDPAIFDAALGVSLKSLPQTWALLRLVQNEGDRAATLSKNFYDRTRPFAIDTSIPNCEGDPAKPVDPAKKPSHSYPSGHSTLGYSVGYMLSHLAPDKAPAILARARDYALSREYCGAHFPSDTEASHVIGTLVADRILARPDMADRIAAARTELAEALRHKAN